MSEPAFRPSVWVITPELHREGATERCIAEQVERWRDRFELSVYTMRTVGVDLRGVRVRRLWRPPGPHLFRYLWWWVAGRLVRRWDARWLGAPHVVYSPGVNGLDATAVSVHIVFAKHWRQVRDGVRRHLTDPRHLARSVHRMLYWRLVRALERRLYSGPSSLWALSAADARELEATFGRPAQTVPVVPYGVDVHAFSPAQRAAQRSATRAALGVEGARVLLLVGNDWHKKGLITALRALQRLGPHYVLLVAGRDDPAPYTSEAASLGVLARVRFLGHTSNIMSYYAAADCLVAPSAEDAFHLPALEAFAAGLPVIVSAEAGIASLLGPRMEALTLTNARDPAELAGLISRVFDEPGLRDAMRAAAHDLAKRMTWEAHITETARLIQREAFTPRVLMLATDPHGVGGIQRATRTMVDALADICGGDRVGLLSLWTGAGAVERGKVRRLAVRNGAHSPGRGVGAWRRLRFVLDALGTAHRWRGRGFVVLACHAHLSHVAWLCHLISGAPYVVWCHGREVWGRPRATIRSALRRATRVLVGSTFTADQVMRSSAVVREQVRMVHYALEPDLVMLDPAPPVPAHLSVLAVARLDREDAYKGVDLLLHAWPQVLHCVPEAELTVVGNGNDAPRLKRLAHLLGVEASVHFAGYVDDLELRLAYARARIFALPGRSSHGVEPQGEGFGLVFLEAAAAGLPSVAGRAAGAVEAVVHGVTGLLVDPESPREIAEALTLLLLNPDTAKRMGAAGRARALRDFSVERFRTGVGDLLRDLVPLASRAQGAEEPT